MPKIINVIPRDDYTLVIELNNAHKIIFDMEPRLQGVRFSKLTDIHTFKSVQIKNGNNLVWDSLCEITIDEIINLIER